MQKIQDKNKLKFHLDQYSIQMKVLGEKSIGLKIVDSAFKSEFWEEEIVLNKIGSNTVIKAFEKTKHQIKTDFSQRVEEATYLQIKITIQSAFLKPVQQIINLKKTREVSESEIVRQAIDNLNIKVKQAKNSIKQNNMCSYFGGQLGEKNYSSGTNYENIASIKLPKGKYLLTFNFLLKATGTWIYLYLNQGENILTNGGWYLPTGNNYVPSTIRKIYTVTQESQTVSFTTYYACSYPINIKNAIIVAKPIK